MIVVKKNNKELTILESQKDSYLALGYNVLDTEGNIAEVGRATEYAALKEENSTFIFIHILLNISFLLIYTFIYFLLLTFSLYFSIVYE